MVLLMGGRSTQHLVLGKPDAGDVDGLHDWFGDLMMMTMMSWLV